MSKKKKRYYAVVHGRQPGVYRQWFGPEGAAEQIDGFPDAVYKGFHTHDEMLAWLGEFSRETLANLAPNLLDLLDSAPRPTLPPSPDELLQAGKVLLYTDGGAIDNPGPGGYGLVLRYRRHRKELSGGFRWTTNNRMELMACIRGLQSLKAESSVVVFSDSAYVVNAMTRGWVQRWQTRGWTLSNGQPVKNADLWRQLVDLCRRHQVEFQWVRGHAGNRENERCDRLARSAARDANLEVDEAYEKGTAPQKAV
jgi:ribonuclease HI